MKDIIKVFKTIIKFMVYAGLIIDWLICVILLAVGFKLALVPLVLIPGAFAVTYMISD